MTLSQPLANRSTGASAPASKCSGRVGSGSSRPSGKRKLRGWQKLKQYLAAPSEIQDEFDRSIRKHVEAQRELERWAAEEADPSIEWPLPPASTPRRIPAWDDSWAKRARGIRTLARATGRDFEAERSVLLTLPAERYVPALTGDDVPRHRAIPCPSMEHDDLNPSCKAYETGWRCFGCGRTGTIYDFAAELWQLDTRGPQFSEIHNRLCAMLGVVE